MAKKDTQAEYTAILNDLKKEHYHPVYFLQGNEPFFIDRIADYIEKNALNETEKSFNLTVLYGKDTDLSTVLTQAKRFPMMAERQVVIVKEAKELKDIDKTTSARTEGKNVTYNLLEEYVKNPLNSTILVFAYKYKTLDGRQSLAQTLKNNSVFFTSEPLYDNKVPDWIESYTSQTGFSITPKASILIAEFVGNNLSRIANELDKISNNLSNDQQIDENIIEKYIGLSKEYNVFEFQRALGNKDALKANQIVKYYQSDPKNNPVQQIIPALYNYFSRLLQVKLANCNSEKDAGSLLGLHPFIAKEYIKAVKNFHQQKLLTIPAYLREADLKSKGVNNTSTPNGEILKELVFKILH